MHSRKTLPLNRLSIKLCAIIFFCVCVLALSACSSIPGAGSSAKSGIKKQLTESRPVQNSLVKALQAIDKNDAVAAAAAFDEMIKKGARSPASLNHYAIYLREQWQLEEAEQVYRRALEVSPHDAMTHYNLGILYDLYLGKSELALQHYRKYQTIVEQPDKRVKAWIMDLERRSTIATENNEEVPS